MSNEETAEILNENAENEKMRFTYGSVIRINADSNAYENDLFFIHYVNHEKLVLFSKLRAEFIELGLNKTGEINDQDITSVNVLLYNTEGYAKENGLKEGKTIKLIMKDGNVYHGKITQHIQDMIVVKSKKRMMNLMKIFYIDFHLVVLMKNIILVQLFFGCSKRFLPTFYSTQTKNVDKIKKAQDSKKTIDQDEEINEDEKEERENYNNEVHKKNFRRS